MRGGGGGRGGLLGGFSKSSLTALKGNFGIGSATMDIGGIPQTGGTTIGSVMSSSGVGALMGAAGMPLAMAGLTGVRRGTGGGFLESTLGGAGIGASIGTMFLPGVGTAIGAGIGAAAGALASGIEAAVGDISPRTKAKRYVQSIYHVSISNGMADQIASLAQSKYGNNVQIAVMSPEVRQMLGLYAAGTGQASRMPQDALAPHGASLVESGGGLFQAPSYQYGNAYAYHSNLPIFGGNQGVGVLPNPGGSLQLSLNVQGQDVSSFMTGQVVTPSYVAASQLSAYNASNGRVASSLMVNEPGTIVA